MNNNYLIPANSKRSQLIFSVFRPIDLAIALIGAVISVLLMILIPGDTIKLMIMKIFPIGVALLLVLPIPYYHNVLVFLQEAYIFYTTQREYRWRGWCAISEYKDKK